MGIFPRVAHWDDDSLFDIIIGTADGTVRYYKNLGDELFDEGVDLEVGPPGGKVPIDVGSRSTVCIVDWDEDGRRDLLLGSYAGKFHLYLNTGSDLAPEFESFSNLQGPGGDLAIPVSRSSPEMFDLDGDGAKDLLAGDNEGQLWFYPNRGANDAPVFDFRYRVECASVPYDLPNFARTRPRVCDFNDDGYADILTGSYYHTVHLLPGGNYEPDDVPEWASGVLDLTAWPNPFNPKTTLSFTLPQSGRVDLSIYDGTGRRLRTLLGEWREAGECRVEWNGRDREGRLLGSGVYLVKVTATDYFDLKKLVLLK
ncbi:VCBS repeat-containing protein [bacterium]|nr:VCBS repeat-containing protein [bacterium]